MTREERTTKLKAYITCLKCQVKGHACDINCPTMYEAGNMGEIIENLEWIIETFKQEPCENAVSRQAVDRLVWRYLKKGTDENIAFYEHFLDLPSVTPQEPILDKIRAEISKAWYTQPKNRYEEGLKDQALKDMKIIDKYKVEVEPQESEG